MKEISRRGFIGLSAAAIASQFIPRAAFADQSYEPSSNSIRVTEDVALEMGERFFASIEPDASITAANALPIFDSSGTGTAFLVHAIRNGSPYGYVIFDPKANLCISEFSIGEGNPSPYQVIAEKQSSARSLDIDNSACPLIQFDQLTYGMFREGSLVLNNQPSADAEPALINDGIDDRTVNPDLGWNDTNVLLDLAEVYRDYNIAEVNSLSGFTTLDDLYIMAATNHYACGVSAAYCTCSYYVTMGDLADDYLELWDLCNTVERGYSGSVILGGTVPGDEGPGVVNFCAARGISLSQSYEQNADWTRYRSCINGGNMAIFSAALNGVPDSGHAMAVSGHMTLTDKTDILNFIHALMVYDGWGPGVRILNHNTAHYSRHAGIFFS